MNVQGGNNFHFVVIKLHILPTTYWKCS